MKRPAVTNSPLWQFPTPYQVKLDNGLSVSVFQLPGQHVIAGELLIADPISQEPIDKEGVASIALSCLDEGTPTHPRGQISELFEAQGCSLYGYHSTRHAVVGFDVPSTRFEYIVGLLAEIIEESEYHPDDIEQHLDLARANYLQHLASAKGLLALAAPQVLWEEGSRRTRPIFGRPDTLSQITRDDVLDWRSRWTSQDAHLILAGDFRTDPMDLVNKYFSQWNPNQQARPELESTAAHGPMIKLIDRPGSVQADVRIMQHSVGRQDDRMAAAKVAGHILAGAFSSRLNSLLRQERGFTYGISGGFTPRKGASLFTVGGSFRTEVVPEALGLSLDILQLDKDFTEEEVASAKRYIQSIPLLANETAADIVHQAKALVIDNMPCSYVNTLSDQVEQVTADTASATFRELIPADKFTVLVVGDARKLSPELESAGIAHEKMDPSFDRPTLNVIEG